MLFGRMSFAHPGFANDIVKNGRINPAQVCLTCGMCGDLIRAHKPTGCVIRDREKLVRETVETFGRIDILVNNAGVAPLQRNDILQMTEESYDRVMGINTKGTLFLTQMVVNQMIAQEKVFDLKGRRVYLDFRSNPGDSEIDFEGFSEEAYTYLKKAEAR